MKQNVQEHYAEIARMVSDAERDDATGFVIVHESRATCSLEDRSEALNIYREELVEGIPKKALIASRGCGDPVSQADLQLGETVLDLGCGGGIDAIIASRLVGTEGRVFGLDMTSEMLDLARENAKAADARNIDYLEGLIESIPLSDCSVDVVISNCVINLSDNREEALREALRVLRPGGRFVVSDIVAFGDIPPESYEHLCAIVGCTNGMLHVDAYAQLLSDIGFESARIEPKTVYTVDVLYEKASRKGRMQHYDALDVADVDSKSGSVIITAKA